MAIKHAILKDLEAGRVKAKETRGAKKGTSHARQGLISKTALFTARCTPSQKARYTTLQKEMKKEALEAKVII